MPSDITVYQSSSNHIKASVISLTDKLICLEKLPANKNAQSSDHTTHVMLKVYITKLGGYIYQMLKAI